MSNSRAQPLFLILVQHKQLRPLLLRPIHFHSGCRASIIARHGYHTAANRLITALHMPPAGTSPLVIVPPRLIFTLHFFAFPCYPQLIPAFPTHLFLDSKYIIYNVCTIQLI
jgi:hypothetical protein